MLALQRLLGINRLAWVFLAPNLILFGLFAFLPVILNVVYATTGQRQRAARRPALWSARATS